MDNLMENLNKEQLEAVTYKNGPLLIVAGAGTGKTTVITQRIAYIIEQDWAKTDEILALTFTEKAAGEMEERVDRLLPLGYLDLWISTFHKFGERILREHGLDIGLPSDFKLLNEFEQYSLIKKNLEKFNLDYYRPMGNPTKFIRALVKHFSRAKDEDISPKQYLEYAEGVKENLDSMLGGRGRGIKYQGASQKGKFEKEMVVQETLRVNEVANAYHIYQQLLLDNSVLDFGDLINYCLKLFRERPAILEKYRKQFKYILLDEFQDTNWTQYELVKILAAPKNNLVVVGDDDQSIYKFRGASVSNILQFRKDFPESKQIFLVDNYRNKQNILDLSYNFIQLNNPNRLEYQLQRSKESKDKGGKLALNKKLVAQEKGRGVIEVLRGCDLSDEIRLVVEKIADLKIKNKKISWNDFVILVRANESAKEFCHALAIADLPYQFLSSRGLYAKPVIMDVIAYLKLLDDYHENTAMYRVLNLPILNFSYQELVNFNYWAGKKAWSLYEVLCNVVSLNLDAKVQNKTDKILSLIEKHTAIARERSTSEVILAFLNDSGYLKYLMNLDEQKTRESVNLLNQFMKRVEAFQAANDDKTVKAFLVELQVEIDAGEQGAIPIDFESGPEAIKVMTVHGAKGLEFKHVFIANLVDKRFPTIERSEQILIPDDLIKEILPEGDIHTEEERRLFYVAMTRAREHLYFSWAPDYGGERKKKPSRFLIECGLVNIDEETKKQENKKARKLSKPVSGQKGNILDASWTEKKQAIKAVHQKAEPNIVAPSYFSYTQLAAFSNCPYQYRFAHILKIPRRGKAQFSFGKTMHSTLQKLFGLINEKRGLGQADLFSKTHTSNDKNKDKINISLDEIYDLYKKSWIDNWYNTKSDKEKFRKKGREILKEFYEKHQNDWPKAIFLEKGFNIKIDIAGELCTIRGAIDRIDDVDGKIKIIDYKTGRPKEKLTFAEKEQLLLYQLAIQDLFKQKIQFLSFYYLDNNSEIEFLGTEVELDKVKKKVIETIKNIKKGDFLPRPSQLCQYCDFKNICEFRKM